MVFVGVGVVSMMLVAVVFADLVHRNSREVLGILPVLEYQTICSRRAIGRLGSASGRPRKSVFMGKRSKHRFAISQGPDQNKPDQSHNHRNEHANKDGNGLARRSATIRTNIRVIGIHSWIHSWAHVWIHGRARIWTRDRGLDVHCGLDVNSGRGPFCGLFVLHLLTRPIVPPHDRRSALRTKLSALA